MCGEALDLIVKGIDDKSNVLSWHSLDCFLDDMIAVLVLDTFQYIVLKLFDDARLLVDQYVF
jgi:hypothetical protein